MMIKRKSLIVAVVSSFIICGVLVLTLVGYLVYLELKDKELRNSYEQLLRKVNAKFYSRHIELSGLSASLDSAGALKGRTIIAGVLKNKGQREIADILMLVRFKDKDDAVLYEAVFHPQEPPLGASAYFSGLPKTSIKPGEAFPFKKILANCPKEIVAELSKKEGKGEWPGKLDAEIISVSF